jgi:ribosomal-protein-alanine N-acetyltransferase
MTPWFPLETERLLLREFRLEDEADIYEYASDPEVVRFADWGPSPISTIRANLHRRLENQESWPRDSIEVAVELRRETCLIGIMRITILDRTNRTADFGYTFNRRYWNNGYATEGTRALLDLAFSNLNLHRLWATCDVRNRASYRVMEKLGMRREALFKKDVLQKGEWRDSYLYAVLAEEWDSSSRA